MIYDVLVLNIVECNLFVTRIRIPKAVLMHSYLSLIVRVLHNAAPSSLGRSISVQKLKNVVEDQEVFEH